MLKKFLAIASIVLVFAVLLLTVAMATIVGLGNVLTYFMPAIQIESACMVAGLAMLVALTLLSVAVRFIHFITSFAPVQMEGDEFGEEEDEEEGFAEQVADIVSAKLEPHFSSRARSNVRRR